jgi:hypothetical protein
MFETMIPRRLLTLALLSLAGCNAPQPFGDRHSIIVHADTELWAAVEAEVMATLEQRVFTTRSERKFKVTYVAPDDERWASLRMWHQVVVIGPASDEIVQQIVNPNVAAPAFLQTEGTWARGQTVSVLYLPETGQADAVRQLLPQLYTTLDEQYQTWVIERMYSSGVNDSLGLALAELGFTLQLPNVYIHIVEDSFIRIGNSYRGSDTDLLRSLLITWMSGTQDVTPDELRAWREETGASRYDPPQDVQDQGFRYANVEVNGRAGIELRGVWRDRAEFPAAGPFVTRTIVCPEQNRTYYIDAWLYAPGTDKYPYVRQLEILLDSFRCVGS